MTRPARKVSMTKRKARKAGTAKTTLAALKERQLESKFDGSSLPHFVPIERPKPKPDPLKALLRKHPGRWKFKALNGLISRNYNVCSNGSWLFVTEDRQIARAICQIANGRKK